MYGWTPKDVARLAPEEAERFVERGRRRRAAERARWEEFAAEAVKALARAIRG